MCWSKKNNKWVVASLFNYPANFERIVECLRSLSDLKSGQVVRGGTEHLAEVGLAQGQVTQIRLKDSSGKILASLALGMRCGRRELGGLTEVSRRANTFAWVRVRSCYRAIRCRHFVRSNEEWIQRDLWTVSPEDIAEVSITSTQSTFTIRQPSPGNFQIDRLGTNEQVDVEQAGRLMRVFQAGLVHSVADPQKSQKEFGLDFAGHVCHKNAGRHRLYRFSRVQQCSVRSICKTESGV